MNVVILIAGKMFGLCNCKLMTSYCVYFFIFFQSHSATSMADGEVVFENVAECYHPDRPLEIICHASDDLQFSRWQADVI